MCTLVIDHRPGSRIPLLLVAVRDEFTDRTWTPPARHWPDRPGLVGGRDLLAGGTWLAVDPGARRAGCVLNGRGRPADPEIRRSRGDLPLRAAAGEPEPDLTPYDPFHLITADPVRGVTLLSWNGEAAGRAEIGPGTHIVVNTGLDPAEPRAARFGPRFAAAPRPDPRPGDTPEAAWKPWLELIEGDGLPMDDPAALIVRRRVTPGLPPAAGADRVYGSTSITALTLSPDAVRYDFCPDPVHPSWSTVLPG